MGTRIVRAIKRKKKNNTGEITVLDFNTLKSYSNKDQCGNCEGMDTLSKTI